MTTRKQWRLPTNVSPATNRLTKWSALERWFDPNHRTGAIPMRPIAGLQLKPALLRRVNVALPAVKLSIQTVLQTKFSVTTAIPERWQAADAVANCWILLISHPASALHLEESAAIQVYSLEFKNTCWITYFQSIDRYNGLSFPSFGSFDRFENMQHVLQGTGCCCVIQRKSSESQTGWIC